MRARWLLIAGLGVVLANIVDLRPVTEANPTSGSTLTLGVRTAAAQGAPKPRPKARSAGKERGPTPPKPPPEPVRAPPPDLPQRGPTRIDFDDRLVQGQTNQSGAVVLFARKATGLKSMVDRRKSFRDRTVRTIFDR